MPYGLGWNLNLGKVAVATGLIRPDDSLPGLEAHIPARVSQALTWAPLAGAALAAVAGHFVGMRDVTLPTHWGLDLRPDRLITARPAAAVPVLLSVGLATWTLIDARHNRKVDVSLSAQTLGLEAFCLAALAELARYTEGDELARLGYWSRSARHPLDRSRCAGWQGELGAGEYPRRGVSLLFSVVLVTAWDDCNKGYNRQNRDHV
ncbi:hypothetical protein [Corynebacterium sp. HMSC073D01]|uniref:hypothetical protein n=1 Tax=Corynebacterium sp. HMSC073D01 TaxID=1739536 RepID=UPI000A4EE2A4|nr:hypothetical protein [Corynebacterium sp. HMSC073D01]